MESGVDPGAEAPSSGNEDEDDDNEDQLPRQAPLLEQGLKISFKAWVRNLLKTLKNDCSRRTGDINISFFVENCEQIMN